MELEEAEAKSKKKLSFSNSQIKTSDNSYINMALETKKNDSVEVLSLATDIFHVIHVNSYLPKTNGNVIPCEIAIAEFSLMDGVRKTYHTLINPGEIPLGYAFEAKLHSGRTHQIPLPPNELGETDFSKILEDIKKFLSKLKGFICPLYTYSEENMYIVRSVLKSFQKRANHHFNPTNDIFCVYPLVDLFCKLRTASARYRKKQELFPIVRLCEKGLDEDSFSYTRGISCKFHEETEAINHCSLSRVCRWSYIIVCSCCKDLEIELVPGQHFPKFADDSYRLKMENEDGLSDRAQVNSFKISVSQYNLVVDNSVCLGGSFHEENIAVESPKTDQINQDFKYFLGYKDTSPLLTVIRSPVTVASLYREDMGDKILDLKTDKGMKVVNRLESKCVSQKTKSLKATCKQQISVESSCMQNSVKPIKNESSTFHSDPVSELNEQYSISRRSLESVDENSTASMSRNSTHEPLRLPKTQSEALTLLYGSLDSSSNFQKLN